MKLYLDKNVSDLWDYMKDNEAKQADVNKKLTKVTDKHTSQIDSIRKNLANHADEIKVCHHKNELIKNDIQRVYKFVDNQIADVG